jgi:8-oxo-dGTP pyrophosphatase MutT (NUDIX family)
VADAPALAAAGVMFVTADGRVLLCRRVDDGHYWAFPGGGIEAGETAEAAARREVLEETQAVAGDLTPWTRRVKDGTDFTTFASSTAEFTPVLNQEHDQFQWMTPDAAMTMGGLHPGAYIALMRMGMDELDIARAMAIDELTSPQRYENLLLISIRITGTGASYRNHAGPKDAEGEHVGEYVWRDPSLYLNEEFLQRCQGLPVVIDHPNTDVLDTPEFRERVVGTIMLPFIKDDEVWGIAKIYDQAAAAMVESEKLSTSPGVLVGGKRVPAGDGRDIFVEGKPSLLDHIAICVLGVWDKGGPAAGVSNQSPVGDTNMADKTAEEKILDSLNSLHAKADSNASHLDALEEGAKKDRARMDAMETERKDKAHKDAEEEEKAKKDAEEAAKKDADEKAKAEKDAAEKEEQDRKDKAAKDAAARDDLKTRLDAMEGKLKEPTAEERAKFVAAQVRADSVHQAFGDSAGAPRWQAGESLTDYRKRLVTPFKDKSTAWKDVNLGTVTDEATLANIEKQVFKDAMDVANSPAAATDGEIQMITTRDETGRQIRTFRGDPKACWAPFMQRGKRVIGINNKSTH